MKLHLDLTTPRPPATSEGSKNAHLVFPRGPDFDRERVSCTTPEEIHRSRGITTWIWVAAVVL